MLEINWFGDEKKLQKYLNEMPGVNGEAERREGDIQYKNQVGCWYLRIIAIYITYIILGGKKCI